MRRLIVAAAAALWLAAGSLLVGGRAEALPLPGAGGLAAAGQHSLVQDVRYVCRPVWNGWRWVQQCYWVRRPRPYFYGGPPVRPYPYYYRPRRHFY